MHRANVRRRSARPPPRPPGQVKSLRTAYMCWLFGGWFGLHHFYLERDLHAFITWATFGGYFGLGWIRDFFKLKEYCQDANDEPEYMIKLLDQMRKHDRPPSSWARLIGSLIVANAAAHLSFGALPLLYHDQDEPFVLLLKAFVYPFAVGNGIFLIGNIGRRELTYTNALIGAFIGLPLIFLMSNPTVYLALICIIYTEKYGKQWKREPDEHQPMVFRVTFLVILIIIYLQMWHGWFLFSCETTNVDGENVRCLDAVYDFFESPSWEMFKSTMSDLKLYIQVHGIRGFYQSIKEILGEDPIQDAYRELGLPPTASLDEVTRKYRQLVRQWHPDKQKEGVNNEEAQEKFIEIYQAFQVIVKARKNNPEL